MHRYILLFCFIIFMPFGLKAQSNDWVVSGNFNFGCSFMLHDNFKGVRFPGMRIFCGFAANGVYNKYYVFNYGLSLAIYTKSIGANLNPLVADIQVDLVNTGGFGVCSGDQLPYYKLYRTMDNGAYYNEISNRERFLMLSSNFVVNSHGRNQVNGAITGSWDNVTFNYYNDGGPPFKWLPLADNFDRFWTGGGTIFLHTHSNYNTMEIGFNQFTGYKPLLFEASDQLGINEPNYNTDAERKSGSEHMNYNTSAYYVNYHLNNNVSLTAGWMGALKIVNHNTLKTRFFGVQEMIHTWFGFPYHPNTDDGKLLLGANFNNCSYEKL